MPDLPTEPISAHEFMESFVPQVMEEAAIPADLDLKVGVMLSGEDGGEWMIHFSGGAVAVRSESRADASFSLVQSVEDWRGALWQGRGGAFGQQITGLIAGNSGEQTDPPNMGALASLAALDGLIQISVTGGEAGDWNAGFKLGPGEIPVEPTTHIHVSLEDAEAMQNGSLDAMQAFMSGRIRVTGDMALMMQMQAILMQAALEASQGNS